MEHRGNNQKTNFPQAAFHNHQPGTNYTKLQKQKFNLFIEQKIFSSHKRPQSPPLLIPYFPGIFIYLSKTSRLPHDFQNEKRKIIFENVIKGFRVIIYANPLTTNGRSNKDFIIIRDEKKKKNCNSHAEPKINFSPHSTKSSHRFPLCTFISDVMIYSFLKKKKSLGMHSALEKCEPESTLHGVIFLGAMNHFPFENSPLLPIKRFCMKLPLGTIISGKTKIKARE